MKDNIKNIILNLPTSPGCYQFYDDNGVIIYIGKAKNLKNRVSSYFTNKHHQSAKTTILVSKIRDIKYIVVENEVESLILENNLIKKFKPKYNVLLKYDTHYPSIVIRNEYFPRVYATRNTTIKDGTKYFGPYTNIRAMYTVLDLIQDLYKPRSCRLDLNPEKIAQGKYSVCLKYHIKRCYGPCVGKQSLDDYNKNMASISDILKGNMKKVKEQLLSEMKALSEEMKFEEAEKIKTTYLVLDDYISKNAIFSNINYNLDVFSFDEDEKVAYVNFLNVKNGSIIQAFNFELVKKLDETAEELLATAIIEMRERFKSNNREIVVPFEPDFSEIDLTTKFITTIPQKGDKKTLLELSLRNVKQYKLDKLKRAETLNPEQRQIRLLKDVQKNLQMSVLPTHIECFDNSNLQGTNAVSACVVFKMAKPSKKDYRIFNVKTVDGPDDYETMREVLTRRYTRLLDENSPLPQLVIIDGGKGQLGIAVEVFMELGLIDKIKLIGIAKKLEEIYFPGDTVPLYLDKNSETLKLIQYLRDEAHRFGITRHRNKRSRSQITSELDNIKGIGPKTKELLLKEFKSVAKIKTTSIEDLKDKVGLQKAKLIFAHFTSSSKI